MAEANFDLGVLSLRPIARFRWMAAIDEDYDDQQLTHASGSVLAGGSYPMLTDGDYWVVGGGLVADFGPSFDANFTIDQIVGNDRLTAMTLAAGILYRF